MAKKERLGQGLEDISKTNGLGSIFGSGLDSILNDIENGNSEHSASELDINEIKPNPYQPRKQFNEAKLKELSESIAMHGVFTPILVKKCVNGYELIAGERRLRAAKMAKLETIPGIIVEFNDQQMMEIALLENIQREDLNAIEEANGYQKIIEKLNYTQEELANRIGKSREHVANMLRLLKLPKSVQSYVLTNELSMGHVRALLSVSDEDKMLEIAKTAIKDKLSVRKVEELVKNLGQTKTKPAKSEDPYYSELSTRLMNKFQTKVKLDEKQMVISYDSVEDLNRILEILDCLDE